ncbi:IclR family transcriptional regulator [Halopelagius fulvigenes]|uniref:IclR family transcriptional regulator n=1 Tax=Halopelagius fulvigenes TaxID=1198324 RepID=A0ABD5TXQ6_9EURY
MGTDDASPKDARTVKATKTSFRIIGELKRKSGAGVTEIATQLDLPKSTVHKHLTTLQSINYVVKDDGLYRLSLGFLGLGLAARSHFELVDISRDPLQKLANTTDRTTSLVLLENEYCFHAIRFSPSSADPLPFSVGERLPIHATAGGKAIMAYLSEDERRGILDRVTLTELTDQTITDRETLSEELQEVYDRRQAYDRGEYIEGLRCIAAPLTGENQRAVGAITVTIQTSEMSNQTINSDIGTFLGSTVHSIETRLQSQ